MTGKEEIQKWIINGESSVVEFKEEEAHNDSIAKEIIAFLNFQGGTILFGVGDDRRITGIKDKAFEERIMNIFYNKVFPQVIPRYEELFIDGKKISVVTVDQGINKPYYTRVNGRNCYFVRYGSTSREASREELLRLFQASGSIHYEISQVAGSKMNDLDFSEIENYFRQYRGINLEIFSGGEKERVLSNSDLVVKGEDDEKAVPTIAGMLLFGKNPKKYLPAAGIRFMSIKGRELSDPVLDHKFFEENMFDNIKNAFDYFKVWLRSGFEINDDLQRKDLTEYPMGVLREMLVNSVAHRDYTISGSNIAVVLYENRIEFKSPGRIPNSLTIDKIKQGIMYHRNPVIVQFLYDAGYVERLGRGVRNSVEAMKKYNGTDIEITTDDTETVFTVYK